MVVEETLYNVETTETVLSVQETTYKLSGEDSVNVTISELTNEIVLSNTEIQVVENPIKLYDIGNVVLTLNSDVTFPIPISDVSGLQTALNSKVESLVWNQVSSSDVWVITRPNSNPPLSVRVENSAGDEIIGEITNIGLYTYISFTKSLVGTAYLTIKV